MEMDWKTQRINTAIDFLLEQRAIRSRLMDIPHEPDEVVDLEVADDISNKSIVIKVSNAILSESVRGSNFIVVLHINQYSHDNLLRELLDAIRPQEYCKVFFVDELVANPVGNKMVPKHELCTHKMVEGLLRRYSITLDMLPKIALRDPIVRWYGWKVGDVIKITRPSGELYYRMVDF
jgi:DNA-directed RNA polymerase subunit H (RpoH/RPB5)